ncbi:MAG TPA: TIGR00282 family metallophosphoesterase [Verrucomicrobiae bacterium]|jgi:metallophosphoesterase (TIGR00282 family)|nr:TIGR00282 family metallophosphoesterase [Verrucomicrobiae bacterium]
MKILYVGDVMAEMGLQVVEQVLPQLRRGEQIDLVIAQAENVSDGKGVTIHDFKRLQTAGVDFCTGGNWSLYRDEIIPALNDPAQPIIRPANYPSGTPGRGWKYIETAAGKVLVISLLGHIVGKDADKPFDNPLQVVDKILESQQAVTKAAVIVNLHGDYSSEKVVIGHYLDGQATLVVGDHWHVPTADARVLPGGTAHITDAGMCGALDASLGVTYDSIIPRWRNGTKTRNILATEGRSQFNAVLVETNSAGLAKSITQINQQLHI